MNEFIVIAVLAGLLALVFGLRSWKAPQSTKADKPALSAYEIRPSVFVNGAERAFFTALMHHKPVHAYVFPKVRLEDILRVKTAIKDNKKIWQYRGRIKSRHVDFVLCGRGGEFLCAVELDGSAHHNKQSKMVDGFKDAIFKNAGLSLARVKTGENFDKAARDIWAIYQ